MASRKSLIINRNLLSWYNELDNYFELNMASFPKDVSRKIRVFGDYDIEYIDARKTKIVAKSKAREPQSLSQFFSFLEPKKR